MQFLIVLLLFAFTGHSYTYRRPIPQKPFIRDINKVDGIFDYSILNLLYSPLFVLDQNNIPVPFAIHDFSLSKDQKEYSFVLKEIYFHDGKRVTAVDVKKSLEEKIKSRCVNFEAFNNIVGFDRFSQGKSKSLEGISIDNESLQIRLLRPDPSLPFKLTDIRYAISKKKENKIIGSGPFKVLKDEQNALTLEIFQLNSHLVKNSEIKKISFIEMGYENALLGFKEGKFDDLFFYVVPQKDFASIGPVGHVQELYFPRTYFFAINARQLTKKVERAEILSSLDVEKINKDCYGERNVTDSLVPKGFLGYGKHMKRGKVGVASNRKLKIFVTKTIGSEFCLQSVLSKNFPHADIRIEELSVVLDSWRKNQLDAFVAYFEAESTLHYFGSFNPSASFIYGDPKDKEFLHLFNQVEKAETEEVKNIKASNLAQHILSLNTFVPFFHPNIHIVYSKKFKVFKTPFKSPALIPIYDFALERKK